MKQAGFLRKTLQQVLTTFAHEHSGEMLSLSGKDQILSDDLIDTLIFIGI